MMCCGADPSPLYLLWLVTAVAETKVRSTLALYCHFKVIIGMHSIYQGDIWKNNTIIIRSTIRTGSKMRKKSTSFHTTTIIRAMEY